MVCLVREGGAEHIRFFLVLRATKTYVLPKTFKDVTKLPADSKKRWLESCLEELKSLKDRDYHKWSLTICDGCFDTLNSSKMRS